jgi:hypothetical protein
MKGEPPATGAFPLPRKSASNFPKGDHMGNVQSIKTGKKPAKKMPVAGKSGKDGVTANLRIKGQPKPNTDGQFQPH